MRKNNHYDEVNYGRRIFFAVIIIVSIVAGFFLLYQALKHQVNTTGPCYDQQKNKIIGVECETTEFEEGYDTLWYGGGAFLMMSAVFTSFLLANIWDGE